MLLQIQNARARHPLVELRHDEACLLQIEVAETLNHLTSGIAEQNGFDIVPLTANAVKFILFPKVSKYFILRLIKRCVVHQDGDGATFDFPSSNTAFQALAQCPFAPFGEEVVVFNEIQRLVCFLHYIRTNRNIVVIK